MTTRTWTNLADGHTYITVTGEQVRIDARPPAGHQPTEPAPTGYALAPCTVCGQPLAAVLAHWGTHVGCRTTGRRLIICGAGRTWHTLVPVYRGERTWTGAPAETHTPTTGGVAA